MKSEYMLIFKLVIADSVDVYIGGTELTGKDQMNYKVPKCNIIVHVEWDPSAIQNGNDIERPELFASLSTRIFLRLL